MKFPSCNAANGHIFGSHLSDNVSALGAIKFNLLKSVVYYFPLRKGEQENSAYIIAKVFLLLDLVTF